MIVFGFLEKQNKDHRKKRDFLMKMTPNMLQGSFDGFFV
jgi:hypothetical protein